MPCRIEEGNAAQEVIERMVRLRRERLTEGASAEGAAVYGGGKRGWGGERRDCTCG